MLNLNNVALAINGLFILLCFFSVIRCLKMKYKYKFIYMHIYFMALLSLNSYLIWNL